MKYYLAVGLFTLCSVNASALTIECRGLQSLSGVPSVRWTSVGSNGTFKISQTLNGKFIEKTVVGLETAVLEPTSRSGANTVSINPLLLNKAIEGNAMQVDAFYRNVNTVTGEQQVGFWIPCDLKN